MSRSQLLECNQCHKRQSADGAVGWIRTESTGINIKRLHDRPAKGVFCSDRCRVAYFEGRRHRGTQNVWEHGFVDVYCDRCGVRGAAADDDPLTERVPNGPWRFKIPECPHGADVLPKLTDKGERQYSGVPYGVS
ncbi:MAG: hypothetical protein HY329_04930 [Chloroflexi bacterium]|nr:hypothetical protein [Chloroflexota bacterium]